MAIVELMTAYPLVSIVIISALVTLISTLTMLWLTDQKHLKALKVRQKELSKELKTCKPGECRFQELQSESLKIAGTMMKSSFKPVLFTMIPFLILFYWLKSIYIPIMGTWGWFWWYLGASVVTSTIYRKLFKMA